jgi:hypothetical protein
MILTVVVLSGSGMRVHLFSVAILSIPPVRVRSDHEEDIAYSLVVEPSSQVNPSGQLLGRRELTGRCESSALPGANGLFEGNCRFQRQAPAEDREREKVNTNT